MTIAQFVKQAGSQEKAAEIIGVTFATVNRWINGHNVPHHKSLTARRLRELGISVPTR